jgi:hypothetical protein
MQCFAASEVAGDPPCAVSLVATMQDQNAELLDSELLKDAESTAQLAAQVAHGAHAPIVTEALETIRLPPATPPPPAMYAYAAHPVGTTSMPPLPSSFPPPSRVPSMGSAPPAAARPSWLRALLTTTFPPPAAQPDPQTTRMARRTAGAVCVGLALAFAFVAMITGLRGAPDDPTMASAVAASLVMAHTFVALGAGAFSFGLLRMAERLLGD